MKSRFFTALLAGGTIGFIATPVSAQSDEQLWTNFNVTVKLSDRWRLSEEVTIRFSDNRKGLYELESNTLLGYRLNKVVTLWAGYTHNPQYAAGDFTVMEHRAREQVTFDGFAQLGEGKLNGRIPARAALARGRGGHRLARSALPQIFAADRRQDRAQPQQRTLLQSQHDAVPDEDGARPHAQPDPISTPLTKTLSGEVGYMNQHGFVKNGPDTSDNVAYFGLALSL